MGWHINLERNTVKITSQVALALYDCGADVCSAWKDECDLPELGGIIYDGKLVFSPDHMEHMDYLWQPEVLDVLKRFKVRGDVCFSSSEGDNRGRRWGYRFDGEGGMVRLVYKQGEWFARAPVRKNVADEATMDHQQLDPPPHVQLGRKIRKHLAVEGLRVLRATTLTVKNRLSLKKRRSYRLELELVAGDHVARAIAAATGVHPATSFVLDRTWFAVSPQVQLRWSKRPARGPRCETFIVEVSERASRPDNVIIAITGNVVHVHAGSDMSTLPKHKEVLYSANLFLVGRSDGRYEVVKSRWSDHGKLISAARALDMIAAAALAARARQLLQQRKG